MSGHEWAEMITVGRIVRPHGRRGEVVVESETDFGAERFEPDAVLYWLRGGEVAGVRVVSSRPYDARWVIGFVGVSTIDEAEELRGFELRIPASALHALQPGTYYTHDLVGCEVRAVGSGTVGEVTDVQFGSGAPLLVVGAGRDEVLVPMTDEICRMIDIVARVIEIDPPPGLLDLNRRSSDG